MTDWAAIIAAFNPASTLTALALVITALGVIYNTYQNVGLKADVKVVHTLVNSEKTEAMQRQLILLLQNLVLLRNSPMSPERENAIALAQGQVAVLEKSLEERATAQRVLNEQALPRASR